MIPKANSTISNRVNNFVEKKRKTKAKIKYKNHKKRENKAKY